MLIEHDGNRPKIHATAQIAPNAVLCGDVTVGPNSCVGFGAILTAETGPVSIGENCVIMEHAVLRGTRRAPLEVGNNVLVGPHAHLSGCQLEDDVFIATSASVFPHARIGARSAIRIGAIVHLRTVLPPDSSLPIHWVAVGDPPELCSPHEADRILERLGELGFVSTVFGVERRSQPGSSHMPEIMTRYTSALQRHGRDRLIEAG